jgi:hypothetical protein
VRILLVEPTAAADPAGTAPIGGTVAPLDTSVDSATTTTLATDVPVVETVPTVPTVTDAAPTPAAPSPQPAPAPPAPTPPPTTVRPTTTTIAPTTTAAPTTLPPPPGNAQTLYMTASGGSTFALAASAPAIVNPEPDADNDGKPGLTIAKDAHNGVAWVTQLTSDTHLNGPVIIDLFSTVRNFSSDQGRLAATVVVCDASGNNCAGLVQGQWTFKPWDVGGAGTWTERQLTVGTVDTIVRAGSQLRLVLTASDRDLWIAISGARPSSLRLPI